MHVTPGRTDALSKIRAAAIAGYVTGVAVLLAPAVQLAGGRSQGVAPHLADGLFVLGAALWLHVRRSAIAASILLLFTLVLAYFRYLSSGSLVPLALWGLLGFYFANGGLAAYRLRRQPGSPTPLAGP